MTESMIKYLTTFEATQNLPMTIAIGHGENADLVAGVTDNGIEVDLTDYTARAIYQPSSKFGTNNWYECACEKEDNTVVIHWGNLYDNGDNAVIMWLHFMKDGKVAYPALYKIRLFETPGFTPSAIEPIPEVIDFSEYTLLNAPWALQSDFDVLSGNVNTLSGTVGTLSVNVNALSGNLNTLSGNVNIISGNVDALNTYVGNLSQNLRYKKSYTVLTQDNQLVLLNDREVKGLAVPSDSSISTILLALPSDDMDYVTDFIVDIDNRKQTSVSVDLNGDEFIYYWFAVDDGETLSDILSIEGGKITRLYFTLTGILRDISESIKTPIAVLHVSKKVIVIGGHSEGEWPE